ncbi:MAG: HPr family phosphocarrier protein [Elusimicrobiota bacterium]|jgi:phosphocarrier protein
MKKKEFSVTPKLGMHARPASLFVQTTSKFRSDVKVTKKSEEEDVTVNGKSVMGLMMLAAAYGETIVVAVDGPDEDAVLDKLEDLFKRKFDEA